VAFLTWSVEEVAIVAEGAFNRVGGITMGRSKLQGTLGREAGMARVG